MIEYKDQNGYNVLFVSDIDVATKEYLKNNNAIKKDGTPYKTINVTNTTYSIVGGNSLPAKKITRKDSIVYIVKDTITINSVSTINHIVNGMTSFGKQCIVEINDLKIKSPHTKNSIELESQNDISLTFSKEPLSNDLSKQFMGWIRKNESGAVTPLIEKFLVICRMARTDTRRFIGYANMEKYLRIIKTPSTFNFGSNVDTISCPGKLIIKLVGFDSGYAIVKTDGLVIQTTSEKPTPYTIFTTTPTKVGNETLPFIPIKYRGITVFVSSVILNNDKFIKSMSGGIDLLK